MKVHTLLYAVLCASLVVILSACSLPGISSQETTSTPTDSPPPPPTVVPTEAIIHEIIPGTLPEERSSHAGDYDSSTTAQQKRAPGGDRFTFTMFERPFNSIAMDTYYPYLDIVDTFVFQDDTWIYGTMTLNDTDSNNSLSGNYAIELDMDVDGKGDWLIVASHPQSTDWSVDSVRIYKDENKDVGGSIARVTDEDNLSAGDGFETLVFDSGEGLDPDLAWTRISPDDSNTVQIAVKRDLFEDSEKYMINMWAGNELLDPALFDHSDAYTHEQAGAADPGFPIYYPIKEVYELDNACRMAVGFEATGAEPGICPELIVPTKGGGACVPSQFVMMFCKLNGGSWNANNCTCTPPTRIPPPN